MKRSLLPYSIVLMLLFLLAPGCSMTDKGHDQTQTTNGENPYEDDYSEFASLSNRDKWGNANVHDPSVIKEGDTYYVYSTDAIYKPRGKKFNDDSVHVGNIQIRSSRDLVNWEFEGWALDSIPPEAVKHVRKHNDGEGATNMWAPYVTKVNDEFRMYYSVSAFGTNSSYIGLATAPQPLGPWTDKGCVVKTTPESEMNAIDASVITDEKTGKMWMHYGSFFGGLYCVELDSETGFTKEQNDQGHLLASRANLKEENLEAPEVIYNPDQEKYYLFVSYDALFTFYNVRVGRADSPEGPYYDYFGKDMRDTTNNYPVLTHSYMFGNHPGWSGNAHCGILNDNGTYYMFHQGRLAPSNEMMLMHIRRIFWLPDGWPVVSPERYAGIDKETVASKEIPGKWEVIQLQEIGPMEDLWQGQIPPGGWEYTKKAFNVADTLVFKKNGTTNSEKSKSWRLDDGYLYINNSPHALSHAWDWENEESTIIFSGISENGFSIWGKKINK